jgi:hypothetical protein
MVTRHTPKVRFRQTIKHLLWKYPIDSTTPFRSNQSVNQRVQKFSPRRSLFITRTELNEIALE